MSQTVGLSVGRADRTIHVEQVEAQRRLRARFARAFGETIEGVHTLSVPVRDALDDLAAVLSITAPSDRLPVERMDELLPRLRDAAARISVSLGHRVGAVAP